MHRDMNRKKFDTFLYNVPYEGRDVLPRIESIYRSVISIERKESLFQSEANWQNFLASITMEFNNADPTCKLMENHSGSGGGLK